MGLFGGGGGGDRTSTTTTTQELSPQQQQLLGLVIPKAETFVNNPPTQFPGSQIVGFDPLQQAAQDLTLQAAAPGGSLDALSKRATAADQFLLGPVLFPQSNPALRAATDAALRPIGENFAQKVLPNIRGGAVQAGGFGGSRQGIAEGLASQGFLRQIGDTTAKIQADAFQKSLDSFTKALFATPSIATSSLLPTNAIEAVGLQRQQLAQQQLSEQARKFVSSQLIPFNAAQQVAQLAFGIPAGSTQTQATFPGGGSNTLGGILGIAGLGADLAALFA